mgnify:CR=1 FL=1
MKGFEDSDRRAGRLPLHERIRNLRHKLGITGYELAERAGISPSYVSLIEKGLKVPNPEVAIRIARVLGDDEDLYAAWARSARHGDLHGARRAVEAEEIVSSNPRLRRRIAEGEKVDLAGEAEDDDAVLRSFACNRERSTLTAADLREARWNTALPRIVEPCGGTDTGIIAIPLLRSGADPESEDAAEEVLRLDGSSLPPEEVEDLVAYRAQEPMIERVRDRIEPGTVVVISKRFAEPSAERIHAVRFEGRVILSRVLRKGTLLLLLPPAGRSDVGEIELPALGGIRDVLVGSVVLTIRRW